MFKAFLFAAAALPYLTLNMCGAGQGPIAATPVSQNWPTLSERLECLPEAGALIAAHRGTSRGEYLAENGLTSLETLINGDVRLVEIDVARLRSGEHILFHDGVWEEKSTGRGPLASSTWREAESFLLKDETGRVTADRPARLEDYLAAAKGRVHIEIDFKTSANYEAVIKAVRKASMEDDVILIAYSKGQAAKLARLAPEMALSVPVKKIGDIKAYQVSGVKSKNLYAWIGKSTGGKSAQLNERGIPVLTSSRDGAAPKTAAIVVSDYALQKNITEGAIGLSKAQARIYLACLNK